MGSAMSVPELCGGNRADDYLSDQHRHHVVYDIRVSHRHRYRHHRFTRQRN